jgi:hypothetical protein
MAELRYPRPDAAGASAQAIYEDRRRGELRRHEREWERVVAQRAGVTASHRMVGRVLTAWRPLPPAFTDPETEAWAVGAAGERSVGAVLDRCDGIVVLHDRARPRSRANLDHVVVAGAGVYVIDTKAYNACVELYRYGCWPWWGTGLAVAGSDRHDLLDAVRDQARSVEDVLAAHDVHQARRTDSVRERSANGTLRYVSSPLSIRFDPKILDRLRRRARAVPGATPSGLAERLIDEGLRMAEHPGIVFKDGPSGRRAALAIGPDVWEVVKASKEMDERGQAAVVAVADILNLAEAQVRVALRYYGDHQDEIDYEISAADEESARAEEAWLVEQRLLG